jgi:uncharacterized protein (TIGR00299 family) protein
MYVHERLGFNVKNTSGLVMVMDCQLSGVSGDMILGALLGAGANESKVIDAVQSVKNHVEWCKQISVSIRDVMKGEFKAKKVDIQVDESNPRQGGGRLSFQVKEAIRSIIDELKLSSRANEFASRVIDTMIEAEAKVHGEAGGKGVRLNELGSTDTVADIVGVTTALDDLNVLSDAAVYSTPVAVGGGLFKFSHGVVQSPGPVALEILRKFSFPMIGGPVEAELITPTGASLLVNTVHVASVFYPDMKPSAIGYGAGTKDTGDVPNILRIVLGSPLNHGLLTDRVYVLETNLDDVDGEVIGFVMEKLMNENARDVCVIPVTMKKNRPGQILKVIIDEKDIERISRMIIDETGSLGIRCYPVKRYIVSRKIVSVGVRIGGITRTVRVKIAESKDGDMINIKPEYEDIKNISIETGKVFREVHELVKKAAREKLSEEGQIERDVENEE